jgi:hypothetical protein
MNRSTRGGILTLALLGGYYLWRNRYQVQEFLESKGIKTPLDTSGGLTNTIRSGIARLTGSAERGINELDDVSRKAV